MTANLFKAGILLTYMKFCVFLGILNLSLFSLTIPPTQDVVDNFPVVFSQNPQHHQLEYLFDNSLYNSKVIFIV
jgi:hypothetical protein